MSVSKLALSTSLQNASTIGADRAIRVHGGSDDLVVHILGAEAADADSTIRLATLAGASNAAFLHDDTPFLKYQIAAGKLNSGKVSVSGETCSPIQKLVLSASFQDASALGSARRFSVRGGSADLVVAILGAEVADDTSAVRIATLTSGATTAQVSDASPFVRYQIIAGSLGTGTVWGTGAPKGGAQGQGSAAAIFNVATDFITGLAHTWFVESPPPGGYRIKMWRNDTGASVWFTRLTWSQPGTTPSLIPPAAHFTMTARVWSAAQPNEPGQVIGTFTDENGIEGDSDNDFSSFTAREIPDGASIYLALTGDGSWDLPAGVHIQATLSTTPPTPAPQ